MYRSLIKDYMKIFYSFLILLLICNTSYAKRLDEMNANTSPDITNDFIYSQDVSDTSENSHGTGKSLTIKNLLKAGNITVDGVNVGINTVGPTQQLEVIGTVKATSFIGDGSGLTGVSGSSTISDTAYGVGWDGDTTTGASKNALYDKIETLGSASISDAVYGAGWDGDTTVAPSKNAVYDKIETISSGSGGWSDGGTTIYTTTSTDNVGIGTTTASQNLSFSGTAAKTIGVNRTPGTAAGKNLTISAGGGTAGGSNLAGGNLILQGGISTGNTTGDVIIRTYKTAGVSGSSDNTISDRIYVHGGTKINDGTITPLFDIPDVDGIESGGGVISWSIANTDGTEVQATSGLTFYSFISKSNVITTDIQMIPTTSKITTGGSTVVPTWTISSSGDTITISVTATASITASSAHPRINFIVLNNDYHNLTMR